MYIKRENITCTYIFLHMLYNDFFFIIMKIFFFIVFTFIVFKRASYWFYTFSNEMR